MNISDFEAVLDDPITLLDALTTPNPDPAKEAKRVCRLRWFRSLTAEQGHDEAERALFLSQLGLATDSEIRPGLLPASDRDGYLTIPCKVCGAQVGARCVTLSSSAPTDPHTARVDQWYGASA